MAKTKRRNDKIYRLSKKRKSVSKEGGYNASPKDVVLIPFSNSLSSQ